MRVLELSASSDDEFWGQEDVKKSIWLIFRDFCFDPKCMLMPQRSFVGHPGAAFLCVDRTPRL
jgi:hypothetical protein